MEMRREDGEKRIRQMETDRRKEGKKGREMETDKTNKDGRNGNTMGRRTPCRGDGENEWRLLFPLLYGTPSLMVSILIKLDCFDLN